MKKKTLRKVKKNLANAETNLCTKTYQAFITRVLACSQYASKYSQTTAE
jgi:hypothetical protein